jgi:DNA primase
MSKLAQNFAKYLIYLNFSASGVVEKPDVIGAIFGQTEGLLGHDLDLRELQKTGRIGRIEVSIKTENGKSSGEIEIPSSLDSSETSLIAASLETIDKVGPCDAQIKIIQIKDVRSQKRRYVIDRAKEIMRGMIENGVPDSQKLSESIMEAVRTNEVSAYQGISCGPDLKDSDEIIVVEGRADVINLLKNGIRNAIAIEGSKIPDAIIGLSKEKIVTAFLDGDRGGDLDLKKLLSVADIDFIARAENGKEVEELTKKQIFKALRSKVPVDQVTLKKVQEAEGIKEEKTHEDKKLLSSLLEDIIGSRAAYLIDKNYKILSKVPLSELTEMITKDVYIIVFDGKINQSIVDLALQKKVVCLVGTDYKERVKPGSVKILTIKDFK